MDFFPTQLFSALINGVAGGDLFLLGGDTNVAFAEHTFQTTEVDPSCAMSLITAIECTEKHLRGVDYQQVKKKNAYMGTVAGPGCGKSHLLDWLDAKARSTNRRVIRITFNSNWKKINRESSWTMEQRIVGRILCIDIGCTDWEPFSMWFQQSSLFHTSVLQLLQLLPTNDEKTIMLLIDEVMLYNGEATSFDEFKTLSSFFYEISDKSLINPCLPIVIPFITSLHYSYCTSAVTPTQRNINLYRVDSLIYRNVMSQFVDYYPKFGDKIVQCLVHMCNGHARSIEYVLRTLKMYHSAAEFSSLLFSIYHDLAGTRIFGRLGTSARLLAPVVLDLRISATSKAAAETANLKIDGSNMVFDGVYMNSFVALSNTDSFIPRMTVWHLFALCHNVAPVQDPNNTPEVWENSVFALIKSFGVTTKESFETFTSRALHVRYECLRYLTENNTMAHDDYRSTPLVSVLRVNYNNDGQKRPFIPLYSENHIYNPDGTDIRTWKLLISETVLHIKTPTFPSSFFESDNEFVGCFQLMQYAGIIRPTNSNNSDVDIGVRLWCTGIENVPFGVTLLIQNKFGESSLVQPKELREYLKKLEVAADNMKRDLENIRLENEKIVLCIAAYGTDSCGLAKKTTKDFGKKAEYKFGEVVYTPVRYPVILLGNRITSLLGESFDAFFKQLFDWKDAVGQST